MGREGLVSQGLVPPKHSVDRGVGFGPRVRVYLYRRTVLIIPGNVVTV